MITIEIPALPEAETKKLFSERPFTDPDANITAWLPKTFPATQPCVVRQFELGGFWDNEVLMDEEGAGGGAEWVYKFGCVTPQQIRYLGERALADPELFLRGRKDPTLFFVRNHGANRLYVMATSFEQPDCARLLPTIYKVSSVIRPWRKGVRGFKLYHPPKR